MRDDGDSVEHPWSSPGRDKPFSIIGHWVQHCNKNHGQSTCPADPLQTSGTLSQRKQCLPARFIAVGVDGDEVVYLHTTKPKAQYQWVALSHQWGRKGVHKQFCTTVQNVNDHVKGMRLASLADTYRDAIIVTRALGCAYLWIDSICIIQGEGGDFDTQAKLMEQVYSGAYVVLAASRAPGHYAGFLQPRREKAHVVIDNPGSSQQICLSEVVDDFQEHVLESQLYKRAWVLQEHALARRTVYFTDYQVYFECGGGVRCESMTKMAK